jgi:hypothetical protein
MAIWREARARGVSGESKQIQMRIRGTLLPPARVWQRRTATFRHTVCAPNSRSRRSQLFLRITLSSFFSHPTLVPALIVGRQPLGHT